MHATPPSPSGEARQRAIASCRGGVAPDRPTPTLTYVRVDLPSGEGSIHVALITAGAGELGKLRPGCAQADAALLGDDVREREVDVPRHAGGVAADIEVRAILDPRIELRGPFAHAMLHVDFFGLIAGEGEIESGEQSVGAKRFQLLLVQEIQLAALIAEEQPILAVGAGRAAVLQECAERGNAGTRADHHDRNAGVGRQIEAMRRLDEYRDRRAPLRAFGEK